MKCIDLLQTSLLSYYEFEIKIEHLIFLVSNYYIWDSRTVFSPNSHTFMLKFVKILEKKPVDFYARKYDFVITL